jgi:hypothetical protein
VPSLNTLAAQAFSKPLFMNCREEVFSETHMQFAAYRFPAPGVFSSPGTLYGELLTTRCSVAE